MKLWHREKTQAKDKAKYLRRKAVLAINLEDARDDEESSASEG